MRTRVVFLALCLMGCTQKARESEERFRNLSASNAPWAQLCDVARETEIAWREQEDDAKITEWKKQREFYCQIGRGEYPTS